MEALEAIIGGSRGPRVVIFTFSWVSSKGQDEGHNRGPQGLQQGIRMLNFPSFEGVYFRLSDIKNIIVLRHQYASFHCLELLLIIQQG